MDESVSAAVAEAKSSTTKPESAHDQWQQRLADATNDYSQLMVQLGQALSPVLNASSVPESGDTNEKETSLDSPAVIFLQEQHARVIAQNEYVRSLMRRLDI